MRLKTLYSVALLFVSLTVFSQNSSQTFSIGEDAFLLNGKPYVIRCGELHYARIPREYWRHRLKMAKAMGLNTVCAYLFWNIIEKEPGKFTWTGQSDAVEFCEIARQEGLYVILRPGPYSCAEWEFGGFPWWLLKNKDLRLRTQEPYYLETSRKYLMEVGKKLAPLQITRGGNILMVQVENEYGSYGNDTNYIGIIRDYLKEAGFEVPLFTCDGAAQLKNDTRSDIFAAVNFGGNPEAAFKALREVQPNGPLMCAEYYPGWFDSWGRPHHSGETQKVVDELKWMLEHKASFSIYMVHGGTTFGTYTGANANPYLPQTSSYDYDAPINESGAATPKYYAIRNLLNQYLQDGETLPDVPESKPSQKIENIQFTGMAPLWKQLPQPVLSDTTLLMEDLNQGYGAVLYQTTLASGDKGTLTFEDIHDYALVYLNDSLIGTIDRRKTPYRIALPAHKKNAALKILVEAMGRVNYGALMQDRKGIHGKVILSEGTLSKELKQWTHYPILLGEKNIPLTFKKLAPQRMSSPGFYRATFNVAEQADTYLDLRKWHKGLVWVNGICLGRFWNIGPTQTMYLPGCWLKKGANEVVVFDLFGMEDPSLQGLDKPILDSLTEKKEQAHKKPSQKWTLDEKDAWYQGSFVNSKEWQSQRFKPVVARYFCLEALSEVNNLPYTSIAELELLDENGKEIPRNQWKILYADSEELSGNDGNAANIFDLQFTSIWHTEWQDKTAPLPHQVVIDLGGNYKISGIKVLPRQDSSNGRIKEYRLFFGEREFGGI
ncbi:beta-galactosidase [Danxiaibacter flavus]|uniref:Beta-galactosidase n=1 Tax=Danxiaibacter flavus TaxID=3049108 RepID=A0ABV3ZN72_9BACT|nr:beta-galactosidase [Chitinophagaceae bacterium DXS]